MQTRIRKWGNSLGLRIPKSFADGVGVVEGSEVEVSVEGGDIVIRPVQKPRYRLDELLQNITPENLHDEIETGGPVGGEIW